MTDHTYTPGQRVKVHAGNHPPLFCIGTTRTGFIATETESGVLARWDPDFVAPYVEPAKPAITEIPDGWGLIRSDELEKGVHEVYNPHDPRYPWTDNGVRETANLRFPILVVARRIEATR